MSYYQVLKKTVTKSFDVEIHEQNHGCFEHHELGDEWGGELWFETISGVRHLIDYDGVFALPHEVLIALENEGVVVTGDFK